MKAKPFFARIIIAKNWKGNLVKSRIAIKQLIKLWPHNTKVAFILTCGGFIKFPWPTGINDTMPQQDQLDNLVVEAEKYIKLLITQSIRKKLKTITDYISIGIDSSTSICPCKSIELVALYDLSDNRIFWTGKSYPTIYQQKELIKYSDLKSHFVKTKHGSTLVLGCHDLNLFSPRVKATVKKWRKKIVNEFKVLVIKKRPSIVIQHPHTTDSHRIWISALSGLFKYDFVKYFCSAGKYYNGGYKCRSKLSVVLLNTRRGSSFDFIYKNKMKLL